MTEKEPIECIAREDSSSIITTANIKALEIPIKTLEQDSILDKIRDEIMQLECDVENIYYDCDDMAMTGVVHTICREEVLQIIDNYKAERED